MLKRLRIKNFKGWQDTGDIRLAPLSVFFGANSSGKSSIGQFLMMLKQTRDSSDRRIVLFSGDARSSVRLGSYREMVFGRDEDTDITFSYDWSVARDTFYTLPLSLPNDNEIDFVKDVISFEAQAGLENKTTVLKYFQYGLIKSNQQENINSHNTFLYGLARDSRKKYGLKGGDGYQLKRRQGRAWSSMAPVRFYGFPDNAIANYQDADFLQTFNLVHERLFDSLFYLGPLRQKPARFYPWSGEAPQSVEDDGAYAIAAFLAAQRRKINFGGRQRYQSFGHILADELKKLGLIEKFEVQAISESSRQYEVRLWMKGSGDYYVNLPDVGFGVSQVLPVVVQCFYAPPNSIILMEQPEIHLHPSAQANLADVMIDVIRSKEQEKGEGVARNIQLLVETHSEHFLRRLQRRIVEGKVHPDEVALYFVNTDTKPFSLEELQVNEYGEIENWPKNFFGDQMGDILARADKANQKRQKQRA